ncbi:hypothetical protein pipiens_012887 [Culex pipiens pipiens]|uniref:Uncharacterized protein n=1 Tax=Culex pipiens pipiens TaxID=38569 RepID=A0ABD1D0K6_CULPP
MAGSDRIECGVWDVSGKSTPPFRLHLPQRGERIRLRVIRATTGNRTSDSRVFPDTGRSYCFGDPSAKTENFNDQSVLAADRVQIDRTRGGGSLLRREHDRAPIICKDVRRKNAVTGIAKLSAGEMECRNRTWLIEPSHEKGFVRLRSLLLRKNNPADQHRYANLVHNEDTRRHKERGRLSNGVSPAG